MEENKELWRKMTEMDQQKIDRIYFFPLGLSVVFNDDEEQMPELQRSMWNGTYCRFLEEEGWPVEEIEQVEFVSPLGHLYKMRKGEDGWTVGTMLGMITDTKTEEEE